MGSVGSCAEITWRQNLIKNNHTNKINYRENLFSFQALSPARRHEGSKGLAQFSQRKQIPSCALTREDLSWLPKLWVHCLSNFALIFSTLVQMLFFLLEIVCIYIPLCIWKTTLRAKVFSTVDTWISYQIISQAARTLWGWLPKHTKVPPDPWSVLRHRHPGTLFIRVFYSLWYFPCILQFRLLLNIITKRRVSDMFLLLTLPCQHRVGVSFASRFL